MKKRIKRIFANSFFVYLAMELAEEMLEEFIASGISHFIIKGMSAFVVVTITQILKVPIKRLIKNLTYREGNDKMNFIKKIIAWINANKKSIVGTIGALVASVATAYATYGGYFSFLPQVLVGSFDFMALIVGLGCFVLAELGVTGKGFETISTFMERISAEKISKAEKKDIKEAKAELKAEQKQASLTAEKQEKAKAKAESEAIAKAEKEKADAEHKAKIEAIKNQLRAEEQTKSQS